MRATPFTLDNVVQDSLKSVSLFCYIVFLVFPFNPPHSAFNQHRQKGTTPIRNAGLKWAAIGGVVMGFLGAMKITGNLNRVFFAELIMMFPGSKAKELEDASKKTVCYKATKSHAFLIV